MAFFTIRRPVIEFYCHPDFQDVIPEPRPANKHIADWFKKVPPTTAKLAPDRVDQTGTAAWTVKKCMPVLDAMSAGWVIPLCGDLGIKSNDTRDTIEVTNPPEFKVCDFHDLSQLGGKTAPGYPAPAIKFINPWIVKTRPGWSTLFMPLANSMNELFTPLCGLVDTDSYPKEVNFPAIWHEANSDRVLPAGTPLVVAIPVKRSALRQQASAVRKMTDREFREIELIRKKQQSRREVYTKELREPRK